MRSIDHGIGEMEKRFAQDAATAYCEVLYSCDCPENWLRYADEATCIEQESEHIVEVQRRAQERGLQFDAECAAYQLARWPELGCDEFEAIALRLRPTESSADAVFRWCPLYHGSVPEGEECESAFGTLWSDCEQGTKCDENAARGPSCAAIEPYESDPPPGLGEACVGGADVAEYSCEAPLYCAGNPELEPTTCKPLSGEGEPCKDLACVEGLVCDFESYTCRLPLPLGSPCTPIAFNRCGDGNYCEGEGSEPDAGVCAPQLELGATCTKRDACRDGTCSCDVRDDVCEGTCIPPMPSYALICDPGLPFSPRRRF